MENLIMIGYEILTCFIPFIISLYILNYIDDRKTNYAKIILLILFAFYITGVFYFTGSGTLWDGLFKEFEIRYEYINIVPFSNNIDIIGYILNIILFIPFGFLVPLIWKKLNTPSLIIILGFLFSLLIELSQLLNNRSTDVDDLILNTIGAVIGFLTFRILNKNIKFNISTNKYEILIIIGVIFLGKFFLFNEYFISSLLYGF